MVEQRSVPGQEGCFSNTSLQAVICEEREEKHREHRIEPESIGDILAADEDTYISGEVNRAAALVNCTYSIVPGSCCQKVPVMGMASMARISGMGTVPVRYIHRRNAIVLQGRFSRRGQEKIVVELPSMY